MKTLLRKMVSVLLMMAMLTCVGAIGYASSVKATVDDSSAKFYKSASTSSAHVSIEKGTSVTVKAVKGDWAKVEAGGVTGYMKTSDLKSSSSSSSSKKSSESGSWKSKVVAMKWFDGGKSVLHKGSYGYIYDIKSGYTIKVKRMGGYNHADIEPATAADAAKLKKLGSSWNARPVILKVGDKYVAASINTKCHGNQTIYDNNFDGQICLHMVGSKTHGGNAVRSDHQAAIKKAYNWAH